MYIITTRNMNLIRCSVGPDAQLPIEGYDNPKSKSHKDVILVGCNQEFVELAFMEGSKVYEAKTNKNYIPEYKTEEELVEKLSEMMLDVLGFERNEKGYVYLKHMLKARVNKLKYNPYSERGTMQTKVYPECAKQFGVTSKTVSKHANRALKANVANNKMKHIAMWHRFDYEDKVDSLDVSEFLAMAGRQIRWLMNRI